MNAEIYKLSELIDKDLAEDNLSEQDKDELEKQIKPLLSENSVVLAQANPICGNLKYNAQKAKKWIDWANRLGVQAIIFPEGFLMGIPFGDYLVKFPHIVEDCREWLEVLAEYTKNTKVIIGFVEKNNSNKGKPYYNSVAVLSNGRIEKIIRKTISSDYLQINTDKYFENVPADKKNNILEIDNKKSAIVIGECTDVEQVLDAGEEFQLDFLINCSADITRTGKEFLKHNIFSQISKKYSAAFVYVNQVGASDSLSYDGASRVYDKNGNVIYRAKSYEEQFFIVDPSDNYGKIYPLPNGIELANDYSKTFSLDYEFDLERTYKTIIQSIREYFKKSGFKHACLGLSGGLDSTVCAVLLADALGKENVFGISMPSKLTSSESKNDAKDLADNLGIHFLEIPIKGIFDATRETFDTLFSQMESKWDFRYKQSYTNDNIQARARANILWGISNEFDKCLTIATSDKSEAYMGYATINGDMSGGFAPKADVTKSKLFALAKWLNKNREIKNAIPQSIIEKRPGAELAINPKTGKPLLAEEALMPYEFLDEVIWRVENLHQTINDMLDVEFVYERENSLSKEQKTDWLEKFFRRMSYSQYKWTIMAPAPIVDAHSINKAEYSQPIIASGIDYKKTSIEYKKQILNN